MHRLPELLLVPAVLLGMLGGVIVTVRATRAPDAEALDRPRERMPRRAPHVDHSAYFSEPFSDGPAVTRACLRCHPSSAKHVMKTAHWTWAGQEAVLPGQSRPTPIGKRNLLNNFCISVQSNWPRCTSCHAGYGWEEAGFLASAGEDRVDCLVCHDGSGQYRKDPQGAGHPAQGVDLLAAARSVGWPTRSNCGVCHFAGGGGDAVKHGDLDGTMHFPSPRIDVHMGRHDLTCIDCHRAREHRIRGRLLPIKVDPATRLACTDCHDAAPHRKRRLNGHARAIACQTCHIPFMAIDAATKLTWDWSQAGKNPAKVAARDPAVRGDPQLYSKKKGRFTYGRRVLPAYAWYDGSSRRHLPGEAIDPTHPVDINRPHGSVADPAAKIWPFKVHRGKQAYDLTHRHLLVPKTFGPGGYWSEFNWGQAFRLGAADSGIPFSGGFGWVQTAMYWPLNHMVQEKANALRCTDCHGAAGRLDWRRLGYPGDPALRGGRAQLGLLREGRRR